MRSPLTCWLLSLVLLNHILFSTASTTPAALNLSVTPAIQIASTFNSFDLSKTVSLGIAAAQSVYPRIVPRLYSVTGVTFGRACMVPFIPSRVVLRLHITPPKNIVMTNQVPWGAWEGPEEREEPASFNRPSFDWDRLPLTFMAAQMKIYTAENVPSNRKFFDAVTMFILEEHYPTLPIPQGELIFSFIRQRQMGRTAYQVIVVASSGEVFLDEYGLATAAVQTT